MQACHNCSRAPKTGTPYEDTACSKCDLTKERYGFFDFNADRETQKKENDDWRYNRLKCKHPSDIGDGETGMTLGKFKDRVFSTAAVLVKKLIRLKEKNPAVYDVVIAKMENPMLSYDDIGKMFFMTKQNVDFLLKKSIQIIPELAYAFIIDSRYSDGAGKLYQEVKKEMNEIREEKYGKQ